MYIIYSIQLSHAFIYISYNIQIFMYKWLKMYIYSMISWYYGRSIKQNARFVLIQDIFI